MSNVNKLIVKFVLKDTTYTKHNVKLVFTATNQLHGNVIYCIPYESRSGLHWQKCYFLDKDGWIRPYYGSVRKLKTIAMLAPMVIDDIKKPIPREGKNVVRLNVDTYKKLQIALLLLMNNILINNRNILLYCDEDIAEVLLIKPYDYRLQGIYIDSQSNLELYWINTIPKNIKMEKAAKIEISKHTIEFSIPAMVSKAETMITSRYTIEAALIKLQPGIEIRLAHPEHGEKKVTIDDYRMTTLLALHISSRYIE